MYETKINIFPKGFKKRFLGKFFCVFSKKNYKICKKNIFKNSYIYKFDNILIYSLILSKSVLEYHSFISLREEKTSQIVHLEFFFFDCKKIIEFVQKKRHGHSFASIDYIFNQNESTHMPVRLIGCGYFRSIILGVSFF